MRARNKPRVHALALRDVRYVTRLTNMLADFDHVLSRVTCHRCDIASGRYFSDNEISRTRFLHGANRCFVRSRRIARYQMRFDHSLRRVT